MTLPERVTNIASAEKDKILVECIGTVIDEYNISKKQILSFYNSWLAWGKFILSVELLEKYLPILELDGNHYLDDLREVLEEDKKSIIQFKELFEKKTND